MRKLALALGGAAVLLGASIGLSFAQSAPTAKQQHQAIIDDAAAKLGINGTDLAEALKQAHKELGVKLQLGKLVRSELDVAAKTIGLADVKALRKELAGSTLTAVAQKHNVAPTTVANAIKADVDAKIDAQVSAGKIKPDKAATLKTKAHAKVDALMTREFKAKASP
jgi:hypothetical protein